MSNKGKLQELEIKPHSTIIVCGKRCSGKSVLSKWLLKHMFEQGIYNMVYLFSTTERYSHSFNCIPETHTVEGYNMEFVEQIVDAQKKAIDKHGKDSDKVASVLLILDDLLASIQTGSKEQNQINRLFSTSRHHNIGLIVISQTARSLFSPCVRQNADLICFQKVNDTFLPALYESCYWNGNLKTFVDFVKKSQENTEHEFLCYNNFATDETKAWMMLKADLCDFQITFGGKQKSKSGNNSKVSVKKCPDNVKFTSNKVNKLSKK